MKKGILNDSINIYINTNATQNDQREG